MTRMNEAAMQSTRWWSGNSAMSWISYGSGKEDVRTDSVSVGRVMIAPGMFMFFVSPMVAVFSARH